MKKLLIANRGEVALRIIRCCRKLGISTVAVYSESEAGDLHALLADERFLLEAAPSPYLNQKALIETAKSSGADAIHPGYGFLSENAVFARAVEEKGLIFVGPAPETLELLGEKNRAREYVGKLGHKTIPGYSGSAQDDKTLQEEAARLGVPLMIKAAHGGGGRGMRRVEDLAAFDQALVSARREALALYGDESVILEKAIAPARHIEVQVIGDSHGSVIHLFERECSIQRRFQKVIEEAPALHLAPEIKEQLYKAALSIAQSLELRNAATIEFLVDGENNFYFLEANPRLQVEHAVTEMVSGVDLVELQLTVADGNPLPLAQSDIVLRGAACEARIYAEIPEKDFQASTGLITALKLPDENKFLRVEHALIEGAAVGAQYDPMLAKIIASGSDIAEARSKLQLALRSTNVIGVGTNIHFLILLLSKLLDKETAEIHTHLVESFLDSYSLQNSLEELREHAFSAFRAASEQPPQCFPADSADCCADSWTQEENSKNRDPFYTASGFSPVLGVNKQASIPKQAGYYTVRSPNMDECWTGSIYSGKTSKDLDADCPGSLETKFFNTFYDSAQRLTADAALEGVWFSIAPLERASSRDGSAGDAQKIIRAPLSGTVIEISVSEGTEVDKGDILAVIESMKMEHKVRASLQGRILNIYASSGESIEGDSPMFEIDAAEPDSDKR